LLQCYGAVFSEKVYAALDLVRYKYSNQISDLEKALPHLERSVEHYSKLVELTKDTYLYANSMQTKQRKIPMRGVDATFIHWKEMLPVFQKK
jgi:phage-related protein